MFALTFFITRLTVFPFWICWSTFTDAHRLIPPQDYPGMHIFYGLLAILQCLHVFWSVSQSLPHTDTRPRLATAWPVGACTWNVYVLISLPPPLVCACLPAVSRFYLIARMAFKMIVMGKVEKDVRSDDEDEPMGEDDDDFEDDDSYDKKKVQ